MRRRRILIVEGSATQRTILSDMVSREGHQPLEATTGAEATQVLRGQEVDAVLVSWELPDVPGPALCHRWNDSGEFPMVPFLIMTSYTGSEPVRDCLDAGATDYIGKPPNQLELFARLRLALRMRDMGLQLQESSVRDALTGLYNRRHMQTELQRHIETAKRYAEVFSVAMIDIDFFKKINDTFGHSMGDIILKQMADYFLGRLRKTDIVARFGGEEFLIILHGTLLQQAAQALDSVRKGLADQPFGTEETVVPVTFSAGVAQWEKGLTDVDSIVRKADEALYASKQGGRNRVTAAS
jgi:two-component system, cell cycle response regulator